MRRPMVASHFNKTGKHLSLLSSLPKRPARFSEYTTGFVTLWDAGASRCEVGGFNSFESAPSIVDASHKLSCGDQFGCGDEGTQRPQGLPIAAAAEPGQAPHPIYAVLRRSHRQRFCSRAAPGLMQVICGARSQEASLAHKRGADRQGFPHGKAFYLCRVPPRSCWRFIHRGCIGR
jgi:hypothetical protein